MTPKTLDEIAADLWREGLLKVPGMSPPDAAPSGASLTRPPAHMPGAVAAAARRGALALAVERWPGMFTHLGENAVQILHDAAERRGTTR